MTTIIMGDVGEGAKWWSQAAFYKIELARMYKANNAFMQYWKFPSSSVQIHVIMRAGQPVAFIYVTTTGDYEFFVPTSMDNLLDLEYQGVFLYAGKPTKKPVILNDLKPAAPINTWYSEKEWVTAGLGIRYANPGSWGSGVYPPNLYDSYARVRTAASAEGATEIFRSTEYVNAASKVGNYVFGISGTGEAFVWKLGKTTAVHTQQLMLSAFTDDPNGARAAGFWSFNRAGTKACTSVWLSQSGRFFPEVPRRGGVLTSYVVEVEFQLDRFGEFQSISLLQEIETADFVVAADYDWTTKANELIMAEVSLFDYREHSPEGYKTYYQEYLGYQTRITGGQIPTYDGNGKLRGLHIDPSIPLRYDPAPQPASTYWQQRNNAYDMWLRYKRLNGTVLKEIELLHNRDWFYDLTGTWKDPTFSGEPLTENYNVRGNDFAHSIVVSGMDLRVRATTMFCTKMECAGNPGERVRSEFYSDSYYGQIMPSSSETVYPSNRYDANIILRRFFRQQWLPQTIAAVPYMETATNADGKETTLPIKCLSIYAPRYLTYQPGTLDYHVSKDSVKTYDYHKTAYQAGYSEPPQLGRYFISGAWATTKDRP